MANINTIIYNNSKTKILVMDDVHHFKHYRSVEDLINNGFNVNTNPSQRWAWTNLNKGIK